MECFNVFANYIENRFDPFYYKSEYTELIERLKNCKFTFFKLGDIITDLSGGATPKVEGDYYTDEDGIPFLRVQNITEEGIRLDDVKYIKKEIHNGMLRRSRLREDDLVFTITGRIGSVAVIPPNFEGNINQHSVRFHLKDSVNNLRIHPRYVAIFLNSKIGKKLSFRKTTGGTRPALDYSALKNLQIPIPPEKIQKRIIEIMESAYSQKKQNLQKVKDMLESIIDYFFSQLGIKLYELKIDLSTGGGIYISKQHLTAFSISSNRLANNWAVRHYLPKYDENISLLKKSKYRLTELGSLVIKKVNRGRTPTYSESGIPVIKIASINNDELRFTGEFVNNEFFESASTAHVQKGDILISSTGEGSIGKITKYELDEPAMADNHITIIKVDNNKVNPDFLVTFLKSIPGKIQIEYTITGSTGQTELYPKDIEKILIPCPTIEVQNQIVEDILIRKLKSIELEQKSEIIVQQTIEKVEEIILGK